MAVKIRGANTQAAIDLMQQVLAAFVFRFVQAKDQAKLMKHIDWMRSQTDDMIVHCILETAQRRTRIVIDVDFKQTYVEVDYEGSKVVLYQPNGL